MHRRSRTLVAFVALITLAGSLFAAHAPVAQAHPPLRTYFGRTMHQLKVIFIVKTVNSGYWQTCIAGGKKAVADFGVQGLNFTGANSEANINGQINLMEDAIARHPDIIVLAPTSAAPLDGVITKAYNAGIKVILIDSAATTTNYQSFLSTDNHAGGVLAAQTLAAAIKRKTGSTTGDVAYATFLSGVGSLTARDQGFLDGIKAFPGLHVVAHKDAGGDQSVKPISIAANTVTSHPKLVGYFADNLYTLEGAQTAFRENHVNSSKVSLVGFDPSDTLVAALKAGKVDGIILQDPYQMGYGGVAYGIMSAAGLNTPKFLNTGVSAATPANVNSAAIQGLLFPDTKRNLGF